ncbi:protein S100-A1 [Pempheris klunzingeri]|uniref:protein S100-A1 n=1 Tax=Pempheris klunzingeri TaxID=3127111 RepID=UPI003980D6A5
MSCLLETAIADLIKVFHSYSGKEGDKYKLSKAELKNLLQEQLPGFLEANKDPMEVEKILGELDENKDDQVDFQEFVNLVSVLTIACNEFFVDFDKSSRNVKGKEPCPKKD